MTVVARIERVPLRDVWRHEARDLTRWLEENADVLNDVLGITLVSIERERTAGAFSVDLVAEDEAGRTVVLAYTAGSRRATTRGLLPVRARVV
jgi:RecB family endonuclease NucS